MAIFAAQLLGTAVFCSGTVCCCCAVQLPVQLDSLAYCFQHCCHLTCSKTPDMIQDVFSSWPARLAMPAHHAGRTSGRFLPCCTGPRLISTVLLTTLCLQLEGLDLLNCLITPIFFASTLSRWPRSFLSSVYCMVLAVKGYQMALLLLPAARQNKAHMKARCFGVSLAVPAQQLWQQRNQQAAGPACAAAGPQRKQFLQQATAACMHA